jgi:hypothetical protein
MGACNRAAKVPDCKSGGLTTSGGPSPPAPTNYKPKRVDGDLFHMDTLSAPDWPGTSLLSWIESVRPAGVRVASIARQVG